MATQAAQVDIGNTLPGFRSPAVGPEAPFDMLEACHERVRRSLQLLQKLQSHLLTNGCDTSAAQASQDVLRYFDIAAPLHHQDEELHVFPSLLALQDAALTTAVQQLIADHRDMEAAWVPAAEVLRYIAHAGNKGSAASWQPLDTAQIHALQKFASLYGPHIALEERLIYPRARELLLPDALQTMSADMVHRRVNW